MKLIRRKKGSQRTTKPIKLEFVPNFGGQGGHSDLVFFSPSEQTYYIFEPESLKDVQQLSSHASIINMNYRDPRL